LAKLCGRLMLYELSNLSDSAALRWPDPSPRAPARVFMDPLYVTRSALDREDLVLCHDIGPVSHPELFDPGTVQMYRTAYDKIKAARRGVVLVGEAAKASFIARYGDASRPLLTTPFFVRVLNTTGEERPADGPAGRFLLTVGAFERRKNLPLAIQ